MHTEPNPYKPLALAKVPDYANKLVTLKKLNYNFFNIVALCDFRNGSAVHRQGGTACSGHCPTHALPLESSRVWSTHCFAAAAMMPLSLASVTSRNPIPICLVAPAGPEQ